MTWLQRLLLLQALGGVYVALTLLLVTGPRRGT